MKLNRRNAGSAYGTHAHGLDFHITREDNGWKVTVRPLTETAGVTHALGQPTILTSQHPRLATIRAALDEYGRVEGYDRDPWGRWMKAVSAVYTRESDRIRAEYDAARAARR